MLYFFNHLFEDFLLLENLVWKPQPDWRQAFKRNIKDHRMHSFFWIEQQLDAIYYFWFQVDLERGLNGFKMLALIDDIARNQDCATKNHDVVICLGGLHL